MHNFSSSPQDEPPAATCSRCLGEIYPGEPAHFIDGQVICRDCFGAFAEEYFADKEYYGDDIKEMLTDDFKRTC